jgi:hypothetical protein
VPVDANVARAAQSPGNVFLMGYWLHVFGVHTGPDTASVVGLGPGRNRTDEMFVCPTVSLYRSRAIEEIAVSV